MLKKLLILIAMLYASIAFAAVDANQGTAAELDSIKGIGPATSGKIIEERKKGNFKDWGDLLSRVKGIGLKSAAHLSGSGLTVNGSAYTGASAKSAVKSSMPAPAPVVAPAAPVALTKPAVAVPAMPAPAAPAPVLAAPTAPAAPASAAKK